MSATNNTEAEQQQQSESSSQDLDEDISEAKHYVDVCKSLVMYASHTNQRLLGVEHRFSCMDEELKALVPDWDSHMQKVYACVAKNQAFLRAIYNHRGIFENSDRINYRVFEKRAPPTSADNMSKVRSTLRQCVRDWSDEGASERQANYGPILAELARLYPEATTADRASVKVLVPGSGLGRLPWEIAQLGFSCQGNEFSYHMLLASYVLLNVPHKEPFTIHPYAHETINTVHRKDQLRAVSVPHVTNMQTKGPFSMSAGDFLEIYGAGRGKAMGAFPSGEHKTNRPETKTNKKNNKSEYAAYEEWDVLVTCFFLDTANNILEYIRCVYNILKPGGRWIHLGPLQYHFTDMQGEMSVELPLEDVIKAAKKIGFKMDKYEMLKQTPYCCNEKAMSRSFYFPVFNVFSKIK